MLLVVAAVGAFAVAWHRWRSSSWQLRRRGLPPGEPGIPLFTGWLKDGFYRRQWERYGPIYTTKIVYPPTVAVGGIELADASSAITATSFVPRCLRTLNASKAAR